LTRIGTSRGRGTSTVTRKKRKLRIAPEKCGKLRNHQWTRIGIGDAKKNRKLRIASDSFGLSPAGSALAGDHDPGVLDPLHCYNPCKYWRFPRFCPLHQTLQVATPVTFRSAVCCSWGRYLLQMCFHSLPQRTFTRALQALHFALAGARFGLTCHTHCILLRHYSQFNGQQAGLPGKKGKGRVSKIKKCGRARQKRNRKSSASRTF